MHPFFQHARDAWHRHHEHHHHHHHLNRRGGRGFAGFGGRHGFSEGPSGVGFDALNRGRKLGSADLQLLLLALLAERPSHGYELIKALDERSKGYYVPSPGMVYPALTYLEEIGHASVEAQGAKKLYHVTDEGASYLAHERERADALLQQLAYIGGRMEEMRRAMSGADADRDDDADESTGPAGWGGRGRGGPEIRAARRDLKSALVEKVGADADEQRRIAAILERAAAEIRGGRAGG